MNIRRFVRGAVLDILGVFSTPSPGVHILNGHRISLCNSSPDTFRKQLNELKLYVEFVDFEKAVQLIVSHEQVNRPLVAFTFDDGFEECYTMIAPVLNEFGISGAFFINPNFVTGDEDYIRNFTINTVKTVGKKPMSWEQIQELDLSGHVIGAHTLDHYNINVDDITELEHQIGDCRKIIESKINRKCLYFAFPFGRLEHANFISIDIATKYYPYIFSQSDYKHYFSYEGKVINRRHFEPDWKIGHVKYFLSCNKR